MMQKNFNIQPAVIQRFLKPLNNQRGVALIIAISLLAIMSIIGALLMNSSSTEIQLSGNYRMQQESFYAADRAIDYAMLRAATTTATVDLYQNFDYNVSPPVLHRNRLAFGNTALENTTVITEADTANRSLWDDRNSVMYVGFGPPPVGSGMDATQFGAQNYRITTVGVSPAASASPARTQLRAQVAKIVPQ